MSDKRSWFPTEETLTESMPTDYYYDFFRQYPNAANVRSKQVWNISKIIYILIRYLFVLCDRHISKNFINIKSFHLHNNPVKSLLLLVSLCRWRNRGTETLHQLLENTQQKNVRATYRVRVLCHYTLLPPTSPEPVPLHSIQACCRYSCFGPVLQSFSTGWWKFCVNHSTLGSW